MHESTAYYHPASNLQMPPKRDIFRTLDLQNHRQNLHWTQQPALLAGALIALAALTYWPTCQALWDFWEDENTVGAHGFLVAPLAVWLLYRARHRLARVPIRPVPAAAVVLALWSIAWLVFWRAGIQELHILSLPVLMGLSVCAALGWRAAWVLAFPLGYLYFAVPAWGMFTDPLQDMTAVAVHFLCPLVGVPAQLQNNIIEFPGGAIEVARGCSGQAFLTVGLAVAALLGEIENASLLRRMVLFVVMGLLAILSNWLRVLVIVEAGYSTQMRHVLITKGHFVFGWVLFTTVIVVSVWLLARVPDAAPELMPPLDNQGRVAGKATFVTTAVAMAAVPLATYAFVLPLDSKATTIAFHAPQGQRGWRGPVDTPAGVWRPEYVGAHSQWSFAYEGPTGHSVEAVAIGYPLQEQGRELVNEENQLFGSSGPTPSAQNKVTFDGESYIEILAADKQGRRLLTWSVYDIGGERFVTPLWSQLWYGVRSLTGPPYSVQFAFRTMCDNSCDAARARLGDFLQTMRPALLASVGRAAAPSMSRPL